MPRIREDPMIGINKSGRIGTLGAAVLVTVLGNAHLDAQEGRALSIADIAQRAIPATVTLLTFDAQGDTLSQGSGFFVAPSGLLVTNWHVLIGAFSGAVVLNTGASLPLTTVVAGDSLTDLAVLKVHLAASAALDPAAGVPRIGARAVVVGSPMGLSQTVAEGVVSSVREIGGQQRIQISAPISPGSSGAPVLDENGRVFGVATASIVEGQQLNFAVPITAVVRLLRREVPERDIASVFFHLPPPPHREPPIAERPPERRVRTSIGESYAFRVEPFAGDASTPALSPHSGTLLLASAAHVGLVAACPALPDTPSQPCPDRWVGVVSLLVTRPDGRVLMQLMVDRHETLILEGRQTENGFSLTGPVPGSRVERRIIATRNEPVRLSDPTGIYGNGMIAVVARDTLYIVGVIAGDGRASTPTPELWKGPIQADGSFSVKLVATLHSGSILSPPIVPDSRPDLAVKLMRGRVHGGLLTAALLRDRGFDNEVVGSLTASRQ